MSHLMQHFYVTSVDMSSWLLLAGEFLFGGDFFLGQKTITVPEPVGMQCG